MRGLLFISAALGVMALAFWAYSENYRTQASIERVEKLHRELSAARARVAVLKAEWAYLNRPDRLRDLAEMNFTRLELLPLAPEQFGAIEQVPFPAREIVVSSPVDVSEQGQ
ncbi:MAG: cell division protein FtsL [Pseudomonadota bacterium]